MKIATRLWLPTIVISLAYMLVGGATFVRTKIALEDSNTQQVAQEAKLEKSLVWTGLTELNAARAVASVSATDNSVENAVKADIAAQPLG